MKQKLDFVTNSSSASFIIGAKKEASLKVPLTIEVDLTEFVKTTITTLEELKNHWDHEGRDEADFEYIQCQSAIENGEVIYFLRCGDEDGPIEAMVCNIGLKGDIIPKSINVIKGEGGY